MKFCKPLTKIAFIDYFNNKIRNFSYFNILIIYNYISQPYKIYKIIII